MSIVEWPEEIGDVEKTNGNQDISTIGALTHPWQSIPGACDQWDGLVAGGGSRFLTDANLLESSAKTGEDLETLAQHARVLAALCGRTRVGESQTLRTH